MTSTLRVNSCFHTDRGGERLAGNSHDLGFYFPFVWRNFWIHLPSGGWRPHTQGHCGSNIRIRYEDAVYSLHQTFLYLQDVCALNQMNVSHYYSKLQWFQIASLSMADHQAQLMQFLTFDLVEFNQGYDWDTGSRIWGLIRPKLSSCNLQNICLFVWIELISDCESLWTGVPVAMLLWKMIVCDNG